MKKYTVAFWITTIIIFIMEGIVPLITIHNPMAIQGITSLGYPIYFVAMLAIFKFVGATTLIIPQIPGRIKEWAYAGFFIDFLSAFISIWVVMGLGFGAIIPLIAIAILAISYVSYHKKQS